MYNSFKKSSFKTGLALGLAVTSLTAAYAQPLSAVGSIATRAQMESEVRGMGGLRGEQRGLRPLRRGELAGALSATGDVSMATETQTEISTSGDTALKADARAEAGAQGEAKADLQPLRETAGAVRARARGTASTAHGVVVDTAQQINGSARELKGSVEGQIDAELAGAVGVEVNEAASLAVGAELNGAIREAVDTEIAGAIKDELQNEVSATVESAVQDEVKAAIEGEIAATVDAEVKRQVDEAVDAEVQSEVAALVTGS